MQDTVDDKVSAAASAYKKARAAYAALKGEEGAWAKKYRVLNDRDVVGLGERVQTEIEKLEEERTRRLIRHGRVDIPITSGESRRRISWLWYTGALDEEEEIAGMDAALTSDMNDGEPVPFGQYGDYDSYIALQGVRVEWLKACARAQRWEEEIRLLLEEMDQSLRTFENRAAWWRGQIRRTVTEQGLREGLHAYREEHADLYVQLRESFAKSWAAKQQAAHLFLARSSVLDEQRPHQPVIEEA